MVSVITACYNSGSTISKAIESLLSQTDIGFEHIVVDGKSKDNTVEVVETYRKAYLALCEDEVQRRAKTLPDVPEACIEPELLNVFLRLLRTDDRYAAQAHARLFRRRSTEWLRPMPHAIETLDALKAQGKRVFLLSNAQSCFTCDELDALELTDRFDGILLSSDAGMKKPYRGLFELLLRRYGIDRNDALMVGNDAAADMEGATEAGVRGAYIHTWQSGKRPERLPENCYEIRDLSELVLESEE